MTSTSVYGSAFPGSDSPWERPKQVFFEDVAEGMELPSKAKGPLDFLDFVVFAGACGDFIRLHVDRDYAKNVAHHPDAIMHGQNKIAYMAHVVTDWIGPEGTVKKIGGSYRGLDIPGDTVTSGGRVKR